jgi:hypothetical protein
LQPDETFELPSTRKKQISKTLNNIFQQEKLQWNEEEAGKVGQFKTFLILFY